MAECCPVCQTACSKTNAVGHSFAYDCPRCGNFILSYHNNVDLQHTFNGAKTHGVEDEKKAVISHAIRKMQKEDSCPTLGGDLIEAILKQTLPTPAEQKDIFVRWVGDNIKAGGDYVEVNKLCVTAIIGAITEEELYFILKHLKTKGVIESETINLGASIDIVKVTLSFDGWEYYEELKKGDTDSRKAFMAMEYGNPELNEIVDNHFKPAVADTGFELCRLDKNPKAGLIDDRLRVEIRNSRFLISDLTHENRGAYWEAGYAEGLGKPVIYTCKKEKFDKDKPHFDTNHHLTIIWDKKEIDKAMESLKATIRATLPDEAKMSDD